MEHGPGHFISPACVFRVHPPRRCGRFAHRRRTRRDAPHSGFRFLLDEDPCRWPGGSRLWQSPRRWSTVNVIRSRGQWQSFDIIFKAPVFDGDKVVRSSAVTGADVGITPTISCKNRHCPNCQRDDTDLPSWTSPQAYTQLHPPISLQDRAPSRRSSTARMPLDFSSGRGYKLQERVDQHSVPPELSSCWGRPSVAFPPKLTEPIPCLLTLVCVSREKLVWQPSWPPSAC